MNYEASHLNAMNLIEEAILERRNGNFDKSKELLSKAFAFEKNAALMAKAESAGDHLASILFKSAASIAIDIELFEEANALAREGLLETPPSPIKDELEKIQQITEKKRGDSNLSRNMPRPFLRLTDAEISKLEYVRQLIESNLRTHYTIPTIAQAVGLNEFKLKTGFKALYGKPIFEFLQELRMDKALYYLHNTDLPINEISYQVGYGSPTNFVAAFRKRFGRKPTEEKKFIESKTLKRG